MACRLHSNGKQRGTLRAPYTCTQEKLCPSLRAQRKALADAIGMLVVTAVADGAQNHFKALNADTMDLAWMIVTDDALEPYARYLPGLKRCCPPTWKNMRAC